MPCFMPVSLQARNQAHDITLSVSACDTMHGILSGTLDGLTVIYRMLGVPLEAGIRPSLVVVASL
jgi:hypothetical protein